ncbi:hypothetical protein F4801DRAFT_534845 [Xylaria longipes]|nr:hypothetical protein F4801DRAFT_534845 [Xylaria longipes]
MLWCRVAATLYGLIYTFSTCTPPGNAQAREMPQTVNALCTNKPTPICRHFVKWGEVGEAFSRPKTTSCILLYVCTENYSIMVRLVFMICDTV